MIRKPVLYALLLALLLALAACSATDTALSETALSDTPASTSSSAAGGTVTAPAGDAASSSEGTADEPSPFGDFSATTLEGDPIDQSIFAGADLTMLNAWGTFCGPCLQEMPGLGELAAEYADRGFQIVGVVLDVFDQSGNVVEDQLATARSLVEETGAAYTHIVPTLEMYTTNLKDVIYIPQTFFIDGSGNIVASHTGAMEKADWQALIDELLAEVTA